jgi:hypothetical protein
VKQSKHVRLRDDEHVRGGHSDRALTPLAGADKRLVTEERSGPQDTADRFLAGARRHGNQIRRRSMCITLPDGSPWRKMAAGGP